MNQCIKCGKEIPQGELFCMECSLNPGSSLFDEPKPAEKYPLPKGRMQTPKPVVRPAVQQTVPAAEARTGGKGLAIALAVVSVLLAATLAFLIWQYSGILVQKNRLRTKEADLALRETEIQELYDQLDAVTLELDQNKQALAAKQTEIEELEAQLSSSQSSQSQGQYDLATKQTELDKLEEENQQLLALADELDLEVAGLKEEMAALEAALAEAEHDKTKAQFMDSYVVFVENNGTGHYHTYDCSSFSRSNFWAYSRKLAEANGFTPCPTCGGTP